jgi:hypothetical protein
MKSQVLVYVIVISLLLSITLFAGNEIMKGNSQVQSQIDSIAIKLSKYEIGKIEILQIPPRIETRTRITPEMLEKSFDYKLTISDARGGVYGDKLAELLKTLVVQPRSEMADIRWGIIFYDMNDSRAGAIYFDRWGRNGAVGDVPVSFKGDLFKWLDGNCSRCFR